MSIKIKSTKSFYHLPVAHAQYHDMTPDREPGACAAIHGYDRSVHLTFAGEIDDHGWIYPFGDLKPVKEFLEYYFDHTVVLPADDPRLESIPVEMLECGQLLGSMRILPYGVSMEMSSLFAWEYINPYIYHTTGGRVYLERIEFREHERNSAFLEVDEDTAKKQAEQYRADGEFLTKITMHEYQAPKLALARHNS